MISEQPRNWHRVRTSSQENEEQRFPIPCEKSGSTQAVLGKRKKIKTCSIDLGKYFETSCIFLLFQKIQPSQSHRLIFLIHLIEEFEVLVYQKVMGNL